MEPTSWTRRESCVLCGESGRKNLLEKEGASYVKCRRCGLVYTDPAPSGEELRRVAEEWARKHHAGAHRLQWEGNPDLQELIHGPRMWRMEAYRHFNRLLDVGCSTGDFLEYASRRGWNTAGCELASHTTEVARGRLGCEIRTGPFEASGFEEESFDVVTMWDVIEHLHDPVSAVMEAWRILRPGGLLAISTPNYNSFSRHVLGKKWEGLIPPRHLFVFSPRTARRLIAATGGRLAALRTVDINPLDIASGILRREEYGYESRQRNISAVKGFFLKYPFLSGLRSFANDVLSLARLGDVMEIYAERGP